MFIGEKTRIYIAVLLTAIVALFSCKQEEQICDVVILYTTDVHGNVLPYDFNKNTTKDVSLANASTLIKQLTKEYGRKLLLIDGGDFFQGTPSMYYYNYYSVNEPHLISRVSNYLGYDALIMGNHDLESGEAKVENINTELEMPRFGGNVIDTRIRRSFYRPYKIYESNGLKLAVLGLLTPETIDQIPKSLIPHIDITTMLSSAKKWVNELREYENVDYIVCVMHTGLKDVNMITEEGDTIKDGLNYVVNEVRGIDLMLFGHDHGVYEGNLVNQYGDTVHILQSAAHGEEIGRINIHLERDQNNNLIKTTDTERIKLSELPIDTEYVNNFSDVIDSVNKFLDRPLGFVDEDLDMVGTLYKQTNTMNFIHGIQLEATGADISLSSALSTFRDIPAGPMTARTLFTLYKYDNQLHKMWMTGAEIKTFLEYGYSRQFDRMTSEDSHLLAFQYDKNGRIIYGRFGPELITPQYNYSSAAGINYEVDLRRPKGDRVKILSMADGTPFDYNRQYTVAISSYQAAGGGGFVNRGLGWTKDDIAYHTLSISSKTITKIISDHITKSQHLNPTFINVGEWKVIPEDWAERMGPKDAQLLIPYIAK